MTNRPFLTLLHAEIDAPVPASEAVLGDDCLEELARFSASAVDEIAHQNSSYLIRDNDYRLLEILDNFATITSREDTVRTLRRITMLLSNVSVDIRLPAFRKFNVILQAIAKKYAISRPLFDHCTQTLLAFRSHMEASRQHESSAVKLEWVELEKAVYHLSVWEEMLESAQEHNHA
jgi:hypothetical protein